VTALSYLELVTKYPQAAGAALDAQKAFGRPFVTFLVAFVVMCSGITSASTASRFFAANFVFALHVGRGTAGVVVANRVHGGAGRGEPTRCGRKPAAQRRAVQH
jgi:amino acid transporter